jgi:hypothetical protein
LSLKKQFSEFYTMPSPTTLPDNILRAVQTWQPSGLAYFSNLCCFAEQANKKFKDFQKKEGNLGDTVTFDVPPDSIASNGLVATFQASTQKLESLTCDQAANVSRMFTNQQDVFNLEADDYMQKFGMADIEELANTIEGNLALNATSAVPVMTVDANGQSVPTGALHYESGPYRFYGDGVTAINSYQQLQQAVTNFKNPGAPQGIKFILPDTVVPSIVGSGLNQFTPERNNETAQSWEIGDFGTPRVKYLQSNLLPVHVAGTVGNSAAPANQLTVVSTNDPTGANVTQITFSSSITTDSQAILAGDLFQFMDGISGQQNVRLLTYRGHVVSSQPVQCRAAVNAALSGGQVTITLSTPLIWQPGPAQNINTPILAGMKVQVMPSHKSGLIIGGDAFFLAMPQLPEEVPYPTMSKNDSDTGITLRMYYGSIFGKNQRGMIYDNVWGSHLVQKYSMRVLFPVTV